MDPNPDPGGPNMWILWIRIHIRNTDALIGNWQLQNWDLKFSGYLPWAWAPPPREPGPVGPGGPLRYGRNDGGPWGIYLELERLRPVNLVQSVQEGRDGTGETTRVSEALLTKQVAQSSNIDPPGR